MSWTTASSPNSSRSCPRVFDLTTLRASQNSAHRRYLMRSILSSVSLLAATTLLATPVHPVSAQVAAVTQTTRLPVGHASLADDPMPRTIAEYRFVSTRGADLPTRVTVADSA